MVLSVLLSLDVMRLLARGDSGEIQDMALVGTKPKLIKPLQPVYPYNQAMAGLDGAVKVEFVIDKEGKVRNPYVVESNNPAFERPALDAVLQWKFSPGIVGGQPVFVRAQQLIEFRLDGGQKSTAWKITKGKDHSKLPEKLQWDKPPVPVSTAFPVYPFSALEASTKGKTQLKFVVGPDGTVVEAKVIQATTPEMGLAALAMIDVWRFKPAKKKDGTPGFAILSLEHEFNPSGFGDVPVTESARRILGLLRKHPDKIVPSTQLDAMPKPISRRPPEYPLALHQAGQTGSAMISFYIDEEGDAQLPTIVSSSAPGFGYAAAQAVATWRFEPPKKAGKTVVSRAKIPIEFTQGPLPEATSP